MNLLSKMKYYNEIPNMSFVHVNPGTFAGSDVRRGYITNGLSRSDLLNADVLKGLETEEPINVVISPYWDIDVREEIKRREEEKLRAIERRVREREEVQRAREREEQRVMKEELQRIRDQRIRDQEQQNLMREKQILMERKKNYQKKLEELRVIMANPEKFRLLESRLRTYMENIRKRNESDQQ
jgi:hypothetical protein